MTTHIPMPSLTELQATYAIDPASTSGLSRIKTARGPNGKVGPVVSIGTDGYYRMQFKRQFYRTSRVIYFMHAGSDPAELVVDHIDGNKLNNSVGNLRTCTVQENLWNAKRRSNKSDGLPKGIIRCGNSYAVKISIGGDGPSIKIFDDLSAAIKYGDQLRKQYHGEFASNS
ncbi:hypothetical protein D3C77_342200 [compost metagenome]